MSRILFVVFAMSLAVFAVAEETSNPTRDILVTFDNSGARSASGGLSAPYLHRKRYSVARQVRRDAKAVAKEYALEELEHWPIKALSVYCYVYRIAEGDDRKSVIAKLNADVRVESAQPLQSFETSTTEGQSYDDTYANLQYGLNVLGIAAAHRTTKGAGIRIAIIDSHIDKNHEDLRGRIDRVRVFFNKRESIDRNHGTAVASVIGARANNALGIVGIAPEASLELYASCWSGGAEKAAICDSFSLSKALDAMLSDPPHVLNLSLTGPHDPLVERLIKKVCEAGVVVVAAGPTRGQSKRGFPSSMQQVIAVGATPTEESSGAESKDTLFAPGNRILVAIPTDQYDFRSGSSLAAAHVSGVVALMLAVAPDQARDEIGPILQRSQVADAGAGLSINACDALNMIGPTARCGTDPLY